MSSFPAPPLPPTPERLAPDDWSAIDFISDLHLQSDTLRTFEAWREHMLHTPAQAVFILGDLFETWVGDDARNEAFERECAEVLSRAGRRCFLAFMAGNRDFLVGRAMLDPSGTVTLADPTVLTAFGRRTLLTHGDRLCLSDVAYQRFREQVRDEAFIARFLLQPLEERRDVARRLRDGSEHRKRSGAGVQWPDVDLEALARWLREARCDTVVHGHTHRPATETFAPGLIRHVLADWDLDAADAPDRRAEVLRLSARGFERLPPATRDSAPP
jgi:UDP-2,3-diacylglucosamine hydrolase